MTENYCIKSLYFTSDYHLMSWNEMRIGTIYYHIHAHYFAIKTGYQSFFDITNNRASRRSQLLQDGKGGDYKNFIECTYRMHVNGGDISGK